MEILQRMTVVRLLSVVLAMSGFSVAQFSPSAAEKPTHAESVVPGLHDFDFLFGRWQVHHRKLKERLGAPQTSQASVVDNADLGGIAPEREGFV